MTDSEVREGKKRLSYPGAFLLGAAIALCVSFLLLAFADSLEVILPWQFCRSLGIFVVSSGDLVTGALDVWRDTHTITSVSMVMNSLLGGCLTLAAFFLARIRISAWGKILAVACVLVLIVVVPFCVVYHQYVYNCERSHCVSNMRLLDHAKEVWAIKNNATSGQVIAENPEAIWVQLDPYIDGTNVLDCVRLPPGTHYIYGPIGTPPECRYGRDHVYCPF